MLIANYNITRYYLIRNKTSSIPLFKKTKLFWRLDAPKPKIMDDASYPSWVHSLTNRLPSKNELVAKVSPKHGGVGLGRIFSLVKLI